MPWQVLVAHAEGEEHLAEKLARPLRKAGYVVAHQGTVMVGESVVEEASKVLATGGPVVLCGTVKAIGTGWAHRIVNAARKHSSVRVFAVQMDKDAYMQMLSFDDAVALYWQDPGKGTRDLVASVLKYYPPKDGSPRPALSADAERRYRELALESCDIIDLANLPESDRHLATRHLELRRLYVALRVCVEVPSDLQVREADFEDIERRRQASLRRRPRGRPDEPGNRVAVGERLAKARRLVVLGDPGAGKSTLIRWIATAYLLRLRQDPDWKQLPDVRTLPDEDWLPIVVRCRDLDPSSIRGCFDDVLRHTLRKSEMLAGEVDPLRTVLRARLEEGRALLLIDGLDEISDPSLRARFCHQVEQVHIACPDAPIIATSRIVGYREMGCRIGRGFEHVTVADLSREEKDDFARRWCQLTEPPERRELAANELIRDIHSTDRIERLTGNPMLLTTLALVKRKVGKLPRRRAELYWEAVHVLLNWRAEVDVPLDSREALPQLEYLAYAMCDRGVQQLREDEIVELLERMRDEYPNIRDVQSHTAAEFLRLLERRTGIVVEAGRVRHLGVPVPVFEFRHLTFQEYLAARALVDGRFPGRDRSRSLSESVAPLAGQTSSERRRNGEAETVVTESWRETLRLCVACCNDDVVDEVLLAILNPLAGEEVGATSRPRAALAALCLADEPNVAEQVAHKVLRTFVSEVREDDGGGRVRTSVDGAAVELAASRWSQALRSELVERFSKLDPATRLAPGGLCGMVAAASVPDNKPALHAWFAGQVPLITGGVEPVAIESALAIMHLAYAGKARAVPELPDALIGRLRGSAPTAVAAAWALGWLVGGHREERVWQPSLEQLDRIVAFIEEPNVPSEAARFLTWALGQEGNVGAVKVLRAMLDRKESIFRINVIQALRQIGNAEGLEALKPLLSDPESAVRREAVGALLVTCHDDTDRKLMTWDLDAVQPFLDPQEVIQEKRVRVVAKKLRVQVAEVRRRYEALAEKFALRLAWRDGGRRRTRTRPR